MPLTPLAPNYPDVLSVEITTQCNLKCKMCALVTGGTRSSLEPGHMEVAVWDRILEVARQVGRININGWGENFTNPRFLAFLQDLDRLGVVTNFSTNGAYLTPAVVEALAALKHLVHINVSIDSPDPEVFRQIRGGRLSPVLRGLETLMRGLPNAGRVTVSSVVMHSNIESLRAFPTLLSKLGVKGYVLQGLVDWNLKLESEHLRPDPAVLATVDTIKADCASRGISVLVVPYLGHQLKKRPPSIWAELPSTLERRPDDPSREGRETKQCGSPWDHIFVNKDGKVLPCCNSAAWEHTDEESGVMGDLTKQTFDEVWRGERFRNFRQALLEGPMPSICRTCTVTSTGVHFFKLYAAKVVEAQCRTQGSRVRLVLENSGTLPWSPQTRVRIATARPRDRLSAYYHPTWLGGNRICTFREAVVPPGGRASFVFRISPAPAPQREIFQFVSDEIGWFPNTEFELTIGVAQGTFRRIFRRPRVEFRFIGDGSPMQEDKARFGVRR